MLNLTRHFHMFNKGAMLLTTFIVAFILAGTVTPAFADQPVVTLSIGGGSLTETAPGTYSGTGFAATPGSTLQYTMPFSVSDLRGTLAGWNLTITSTSFTGSAGTLPDTASTILSTTAICTVSGTCSGTGTLSNGVLGSVGLPAASTAPGGVKFFGTGSTTGAGTYTVTPTVSVVLPPTLVQGGLSSTNTLTIASGP